MKDLKKLKLSIPTLDSSECKTLMGGDIYTEGLKTIGITIGNKFLTN